jgi:hypothetical protein
MSGIKKPGVVVRVEDAIQTLPHRIVVPAADLIKISVGKVPFIQYTPDPELHGQHGTHSKCVDGLRIGELCALGATLRFKGRGGDQIFVVTGYDPETKMWGLSWPD